MSTQRQALCRWVCHEVNGHAMGNAEPAEQQTTLMYQNNYNCKTFQIVTGAKSKKVAPRTSATGAYLLAADESDDEDDGGSLDATSYMAGARMIANVIRRRTETNAEACLRHNEMVISCAQRCGMALASLFDEAVRHDITVECRRTNALPDWSCENPRARDLAFAGRVPLSCHIPGCPNPTEHLANQRSKAMRRGPARQQHQPYQPPAHAPSAHAAVQGGRKKGKCRFHDTAKGCNKKGACTFEHTPCTKRGSKARATRNHKWGGGGQEVIHVFTNEKNDTKTPVPRTAAVGVLGVAELGQVRAPALSLFCPHPSIHRSCVLCRCGEISVVKRCFNAFVACVVAQPDSLQRELLQGLADAGGVQVRAC